MTDLAQLVRITDPQFYSDNPYPVFAQMRREAPYFDPALNTYVITRYEDIRAVSRDSSAWSVKQGILLNDLIYGDVARSFFPEGIEILSLSDPPNHHELRKAIAGAFTPRRLAGHQNSVRSLVTRVLNEIEPGTVTEFVDQVSAVVPLRVIAGVLGLPVDDTPLLRVWTDDFVKMGASTTPDELAAAATRIHPMVEYLSAHLQAKREHPGGGLISSLANAEIGSQRLSDMHILMLVMEVLTAGNITTRNLLSGTVLALAENPSQLATLVADPSLAPSAVEEGLRYVSPVPGFLRTAVDRASVGSTIVERGQHAYLLYMAANRDERVFDHPETFDVTRPPDPTHLAFGFGQHMCVGAPLARLEASIVLEELASRFPEWQVAGEPARTVTLLENGWTSLPIVFGR